MAGSLIEDRPADGVLRLTISNPEKGGALDHEILAAITTALEPEPDGVRCILLTGTGRHFSSGYDIGNIPQDVFAVEAERLVAHPFADALRTLDDTDVPVVAAVNGPAIGGGLELALACDLRVCGERARFGMPPAKLGVVYSHTGLQRFVDAIGVPRTRELFLGGRRIGAQTALDWGLVNELVSDEEIESVALGWATEIAGNAPLSVRGTKRVLRELRRAQVTLDPEIERELLALRKACFASADLQEGVRAFAEKREPRWQGR